MIEYRAAFDVTRPLPSGEWPGAFVREISPGRWRVYLPTAKQANELVAELGDAVVFRLIPS